MGGCSLRVSGVEVFFCTASAVVPQSSSHDGEFQDPHSRQGSTRITGFRVQDKMQANRAGNMATRHELVQAPKP